MKEGEMVIPHLFRCPISLDLLTDPVTLSTGQTYDRSNIEKWLAAGNLTCPVTMQKLHDSSLVPNHTLRHVIDQWLQKGSQFDHDLLNKLDSLAALKQSLESHETSIESKVQTLEKIRLLAELEIPSRYSCLLQLGFLPSLLNLVFGKVEAKYCQENAEFLEQALCCAIKLLPFGELDSLNMLKEESNLSSFLSLLNHGTIKMKMSLCHLVEAISSCLETKELCSKLGKTREILHEIVFLSSQNDSETSDAAIKAMSSLCSIPSNCENLISAGAVDGLITYILSAERRERSMAARAMATIEQLLGLEAGKEAVINNPNGVNVIVKMVFRVSDHEGSESAVASLQNICNDSSMAMEEAIGGGVLTQLLLLLQSQCNGMTKTKARMLLKMLRSKWTENPMSVNYNVEDKSFM